MKLAIEVNGPGHYFCNMPEREVAWSAARRKLLEGLGWRVVSLRQDEWDELPSWEARKEVVK